MEPLGQSQVLGYIERLAVNQTIHLISFEKQDDWSNIGERNQIATRIANADIIWHPLRYHKKPTALATSWDISLGILLGLWLILHHRLRIVHARSYVPSVVALTLKRLTGIKYIFDMRGFWADERVDGGLWPRTGRMYGVAKWFEKCFLLSADHVISLTHAAIKEMQQLPYLKDNMPPVTVIPTCADLNRFKYMADKRNKDEFVLGYVGSAGTWYLFEETATCFALLLKIKPNARFLIINRGEHGYILEKLAAADIPATAIELLSATHDEVPSLIARMDASIFFIKPVFSKQASAPTKLGEFLGCGVPCLSNAGVGDMAEILENDKVGVALESFDEDDLLKGLQRLLALVEDTTTSTRCINSAKRHFFLDEGVSRYLYVYQQLLN